MSLAAPASARYSLFLDMAKYSSCAIIGARIAAIIATTIRMICALPPPPCPEEYLLLDPATDPHIKLLRNTWESSTIEPSITPAMVTNRMSLCIMCEISCAITPCSSSRFSLASSPAVTATEAFFGFLPVANALGAGSFIIYIFGIAGRAAAIFISSTMLNSCGCTSCVTAFAPLAASSIWSPPEKLMRVRMIQIAIAISSP